MPFSTVKEAQDSMEVDVERIDHLGIIAGVILDLKIIERIDTRIAPDAREEITAGEAVAGMIINGLGFSDRPLSLTPQFFENKSMSKLLREGVLAAHFNRFKLGRALDDCHDYGCESLFAEISMKACEQEGIETRFNALDTTSFSLTGKYIPDSDEHVIEICHGYSKDHRPDLKQAILELICTHDGGVPVISKSWDGNASDTQIFRKRAKMLMDSFKSGTVPRYLVADAKLYDQETIKHYLGQIPFITRVPRTITLGKKATDRALQIPFKNWATLDERNRYVSFEINHYGLDQRWIIVWSKEAEDRNTAAIEKRDQKEREKLSKELEKLEGQEYSCHEDAMKSLKECGKKARFHHITKREVEERKKYSHRGRPKADSPFEICYRIKGQIEVDLAKKKRAIEETSCLIIATTISSQELTDAEVITAYKNQNNSVEKGFRFLKDPILFTSSLFVKKPSRIMGLLMVMTLALLVYAIAQRRLRKALKKARETLPNQIGQETNKPTLRWIFQILGGIEKVRMKVEGVVHEVMTGITQIKKRILSYFGATVQKIYDIEFEPAQAF